MLERNQRAELLLLLLLLLLLRQLTRLPSIQTGVLLEPSAPPSSASPSALVGIFFVVLLL